MHEALRKAFCVAAAACERRLPAGKRSVSVAAGSALINLPFDAPGKCDGPFARMPESFTAGCSRQARLNASLPAGGIVRFETDAPTVGVRLTLGRIISARDLPQMSLRGFAGIDVYARTQDGFRWKGCFAPNRRWGTQIACDIEAADGEESGRFAEIWVYLPGFSSVATLTLTPPLGATVRAVSSAPRRRIALYGSSITQGCAASRPGMTYASQLGRMLNCDVLNFGLSGSAKGEASLARQIGGLALDALVMEYDHNASVQELRATHQPFFAIVRARQPRLPVVFLSRISGGISVSQDEAALRREIIRETYAQAIAQKDDRVRFVDGARIAARYPHGALLSDDRHPNDLGMTAIAQALARELSDFMAE